MTNWTYSVLNRELVVTDTETGVASWSGRPTGLPVKDAQPIAGSADAIVLLDYSAAPLGPAHNLVRVHPDGDVAWAAELPTTSGTEAYVAFDLDGEALTANSWSGHQVRLDPQTGRIVEKVFTK